MFGVFQSKAQLTYGRPQLLNNPISVEWFSVFIARRSTVMHRRSELPGQCEVNSAGDPGGLSGSVNHPHMGTSIYPPLLTSTLQSRPRANESTIINHDEDDDGDDDYGNDDHSSTTIHSNPGETPVHVSVCQAIVTALIGVSCMNWLHSRKRLDWGPGKKHTQ